jgi:glucokinase
VRDRPAHAAAEHADLGAELLRDEFELGDCLLRRVHRDHRGRGQPVAELGEIIRGHDVEPADHGVPGLVVGDARDAEPGGRVDDAEIDAELVEPVVQHLGHHRRRAVAGVGHQVPEAVVAAALAGEPAALTTARLFVRLLVRFAGGVALTFKAFGGVYVAGGVASRLGPLFDGDTFRAAFEAHPPYQKLLAATPTLLMNRTEPGLLGCAALADELSATTPQ